MIGLSQNFIPITNPQMLLVILLAAIFHLGTGPISLWRPEDRLIALKAGQRLANPTPLESIAASRILLSSSGTQVREAS
jgi:hypothetical protein